ncbi:S8 family serine peptidase [Neoaquamicrobium sediminum]|uniref:S8 family serine peptidase n=1 Tax=Neoaquamicrobium sediminum TaxID=1849104 RepID=UPI00403501D7
MMGNTVAWRKRLLGAIASGLLVACGLTATGSLAADAAPAAIVQKVQDHEALWAKLTADPGTRAPVIVRFEMPELPDAASFTSPAAADEAHIKAIHAVQDKILGTVLPAETLSSTQATEALNLKRMDFSPMFGILADADDLARFAADPNVSMIQVDGVDAPHLVESLPLIEMPAMYAAGASGDGFHVAIIDTGALSGHTFLHGKVDSEACYNTSIPEDGSVNACPGGQDTTEPGSGDDCTISILYGCGHGTHVAGIAAGFNAAFQPQPPTNGVARDARIISINVFSEFPGERCDNLPPGFLSCILSYTSDQIKGLERVYALRNTYDIAAVNMSLGGGLYDSYCDSDSRKPIIDQLKAANIATVVSAGNEAYDSSVGAPACISSVITVASSTKSDARSWFSNWGPLIDLVAPGTSIYSSYVDRNHYGRFAYLSGTSMAAPHVTGAWATLRSAFPNATVDQILAALQSTGTNITNGKLAKKRINVNRARLALASNPDPDPDPDPTGPANNHFANRIAVAVPVIGSTRTTGSNVGATAETGEPFHARSSSARTSVWWSYTPYSSGPITITTAGSSFDTVLAIYTGSSVDALSSVTSNDDAGGGTLRSEVTFIGTAGTQYQIAVAGYDNATGDIRLNITGGSGAGPAPANDDLANRIMIPPHGAIFGPRSVTANNTYATAEPGEPLHVNRPVATNSVWWRYTPATSGRITIDTNGSNFNTVLAVYTGGSVRSLSLVAWNDDDPALGRRSKVVFNGVAGTQYQIAVAGGYGNNSGHIRMTVRGGGRYVVSSAGDQVAGLSSSGPASPALESSAFTAVASASDTPAPSPARLAAAPVALQQGASATKSGDTGDVTVAAGSQQVSQPATALAGSDRVELVSAVVTPSNDGILRVPAGGGSFTTLAVNNAGADATLTAELSLSPVAGAASALPAGMSICRTDPATSTCIGTRASSVTFEAASNTPVTFAAFVDHQNSEIAYDPATRLYVHFRQGSAVVGTASVSVCTIGTDGCEAGSRQTASLTEIAQ